MREKREERKEEREKRRGRRKGAVVGGQGGVESPGGDDSPKLWRK